MENQQSTSQKRYFGTMDDNAAVRRLTVDADEIRSSFDVCRHRQRLSLCLFAANVSCAIGGSLGI